jgi:hypothetical protein
MQTPALSQDVNVSALTMPEEFLLRIAARIAAAIRFKDAHPNGDYSEWSGHLRGELVRPTQWLQVSLHNNNTSISKRLSTFTVSIRHRRTDHTESTHLLPYFRGR